MKLLDQQNQPVKNASYKLKMPDGEVKEGKLDENGAAKIEDVPPGKVQVEFTDIKGARRT
jgi:type VI secretion system secreted protein VgrG